MEGASALLTVPKAAPGEMLRKRLTNQIEAGTGRIVYIHAGAGYGKTTLLAQLARVETNPIWLSLTGEADILAFADALCRAIRQAYPQYGFQPFECLPFLEKDNFTSILANAMIGGIEQVSDRIVLVLDDLHTVQSQEIKDFLACFLRFSPVQMRLLLGSREVLWPEFVPLSLRGQILELGRDDLAFTRQETAEVLGFADEDIYRVTEGWPLAVGSFRLLLESGVSPADAPQQGSGALSLYLFSECISRLPAETVDFLKCSSCFDSLDTAMLDSVLGLEHSSRILNSLTARNLFTVKTGEGLFRYHALFKKCLLDMLEPEKKVELLKGAARYYFDQRDFYLAAHYAIELNDRELLEQIILMSYRALIRAGSFSELRQWFQIIGEGDSALSAELLTAKGVFLSCTGNFTGAQKALDRAIPMLNQANRTLYLEAMLHKARVLRNSVSFDASNELLDRLMPELSRCEPETGYLIVVEKLYNLCWNSRIKEAYALAEREIERCAREGNLKIKAWLEGYLTAVHFFAGEMKKTVACYEKSLVLPEEDKAYLGMHGVGIYAAKAYQMLGDRERSLAVLNGALDQMKRLGKYDEMWAGYLFAAEIHFQNVFIDRSNGLEASYDKTKKYFALADEYAPLYRKTTYQQRWARLQRLSYSVVFGYGEKEETIAEIFRHLNDCNDYFKSIILARLMGYFAAAKDYPNAVRCAKQCIAVGEETGMRLHSTLAYGILARCCLATGQWEETRTYTALSLRHCAEFGIYEYFRAKNDYGPILQFAYDGGIAPEATKQLMDFAGYKVKKAYVQTLGEFAVFPFHDRNAPIRTRSKKERELFAFLLDVGEQGATKEQLCESLWAESESQNVKRLISVTLAQLKKDLAPLGIDGLIQCHNKRYWVFRDEIFCDFELFDRASEKKMPIDSSTSTALLSLYGGEYLADFEAFWATAKRIKYHKLYEEALQVSRLTLTQPVEI